jgi:GTP-binding protein Era
LNALVGSKVAIVADKPQTTRTSIQGVANWAEGQVVFVDTPGIHRSGNGLNKRMMGTVREAMAGRDLLIYVTDCTAPFCEKDTRALDLVRKAATPTILAVNKVDALANKALLLPLLSEYRGLFDFAEYIPVSALKEDGLDRLRAAILARLPEGPAYFPPDHLTDQPERFLASELIREKVLKLTREEVPHAVAVLIDRWEETPRLTRIYATIYVEKEGQKGILIGTGGQMMKTIGTEARLEMERLLGRHLYLELHIKVRPKWRQDRAFLNAMDWRTMAGADDAEPYET